MTDELKRLTAARDAAWKEVRRAKSSWWGAIKRRVDYDQHHYILHRSQEYRDAKKKWIAAFKAECEATRAARLANPDWLRCIFPKSSRGLPISALSVRRNDDIHDILHDIKLAIGVSDLRKSEKDGKALIGGRRTADIHGAICAEHKKFMKEDAENGNKSLWKRRPH